MTIANGLTIPNSLANGQATDAPAVMANYNALLVGLNRALLDAGSGAGMNAFGSQIHNLGAGTVATDAATFGQIGLYLPLAGGSITGALVALNGLTATTQAVGDASAKAATTAFVQAQLASALGALTYLSKSGGTMTGGLVTAASVAAGAGINVPPGTAPTTPANGDLWTTSAGVFARVAGATLQFQPTSVAQVWSSPTRAAGTLYTNSTSQERFVSVSIASNESGGDFQGTIVVGAITVASGFLGGQYSGHASRTIGFPVPAGATYQVNVGSGGSVVNWAERG